MSGPKLPCCEELERLREENTRLRTYGQDVGAVLLDELTEQSPNNLTMLEAANVLVAQLVENAEDAFVIHELTGFVEEVDGTTAPERYDLLIQKAGAQSYQENLDACKAHCQRLNTKLIDIVCAWERSNENGTEEMAEVMNEARDVLSMTVKEKK